jgi:hypothetical protein
MNSDVLETQDDVQNEQPPMRHPYYEVRFRNIKNVFYGHGQGK